METETPNGNPNPSNSLVPLEEGSKKLTMEMPFEPTDQHRADAYKAGKVGLNSHDAAFFVRDRFGKPISINTFKKYLWDDYERGRLDSHTAVGAAILQKALKPKMDMVGFLAAQLYLKSKAGWSEKNTLEVSGPNGGPIEHEHEHTLSMGDTFAAARTLLQDLADSKAGGHIIKDEMAIDGTAEPVTST